MSSFKVWVHGLLAAAISAFSTAAMGVIALPTVFSFTRDGFINMATSETTINKTAN